MLKSHADEGLGFFPEMVIPHVARQGRDSKSLTLPPPAFPSEDPVVGIMITKNLDD